MHKMYIYPIALPISFCPLSRWNWSVVYRKMNDTYVIQILNGMNSQDIHYSITWTMSKWTRDRNRIRDEIISTK